MSRISRIAKKVVGIDIRDIEAWLDGLSAKSAAAKQALRNNDATRLSRILDQMGVNVPALVTMWIQTTQPQRGPGKYAPTESWKIQVARDIETIFGRGLLVTWEYSSFLTFSEGTSNKFHYFAVIKAGGEYVGGNAYGRIGSSAKVIEIVRGKSLSSVMSVVRRKEYEKEAKGYQRE